MSSRSAVQVASQQSVPPEEQNQIVSGHGGRKHHRQREKGVAQFLGAELPLGKDKTQGGPNHADEKRWQG